MARTDDADETPASTNTSADEADSQWDPSFEDVLAAARRGDGAAFAQLYRHLNRRVHGFVRFRGGSEPEDLVNEVFLQVFTGIDGFEGSETQFVAWVFTIARNKVVDQARRRQRRPREVAADDTDLSSAGSVSIDDELARQAGEESILRFLDLLTADQRDVIVLRIVADLTVESVAEVLGKRIGAVKALQRRAFRTISRAIDDDAVPL